MTNLEISEEVRCASSVSHSCTSLCLSTIIGIVQLCWSACSNSPEQCGTDSVAPSAVDSKLQEASIWVEPSHINQVERQALAPGNFMILKTVTEFLSGVYSIRPQLFGVHFPFQYDSDLYASEREYEDYLQRIESKNRYPSNKMRQYSINIVRLSIITIDSATNDIPAEINTYPGGKNKYMRIRKYAAHRQTCLVIADMLYESLQSIKVERGKCLFYCVKVNDTWKVCWFDK